MSGAPGPKRGSLRLPRTGLPYYGQSIGIVMVDTASLDAKNAQVNPNFRNELTSRVPGDVGNASTYGFSVQFKLVGGLSINDVISKRPTEKGTRSLVQAVQELEAEGVRAVATTCGFFSYFQPILAAAVRIPVYTSALLQVPMVARSVGPNQKVGIITANSSILTTEHLAAVGIDKTVPHVLWGAETRPPEEDYFVWDEFDPYERTERIEKAMALTAQRMLEAHPTIGAIVLECTNTPPGALAVQEATGLPVFDVVTLIKWAHLGAVQRRYLRDGYM